MYDVSKLKQWHYTCKLTCHMYDVSKLGTDKNIVVSLLRNNKMNDLPSLKFVHWQWGNKMGMDTVSLYSVCVTDLE